MVYHNQGPNRGERCAWFITILKKQPSDDGHNVNVGQGLPLCILRDFPREKKVLEPTSAVI